MSHTDEGLDLIFPATLYEDEVFRLRAGVLGSPELVDKQTNRTLKLTGAAYHFLGALLVLARKKYGAPFVDAPQVRSAFYDFCLEMAGGETRARVFLATTDPTEFFGRSYRV